MRQTIRPASQGPIHAYINIPGCKAITDRAILLAALADGVSEITGMFINQDTHTFINALYQLGIVSQLDQTNHSCIIAGGNGRFPKKQATIWCADAFVVVNFLLASCAATPGVYYFDGSPNLRSKPIDILLSFLSRQGVQLIPNDVQKIPFTLVGADTLEGGDIVLDKPVTSILISSLLMTAPYARSAFSFTLTKQRQQPRVDMTCSMMAEFGVLVHRIHQSQFMVPVPQRYQSRDYAVEPDLALAAYFFAAAAITQGEISIPAVKRLHSKQTAAKFLTLLEKMGCRINETHTSLTAIGPQILNGVDANVHEFSDIAVILMAIAPFANTTTTISLIGEIEKEGIERMNAMKTILVKMGVAIEINKDTIVIQPSQPKSGVYTCHNDRRIAMALALIGLKIPGIIIDHVECINKHYPEFLKLWEQLVAPKSIVA